MPDKNFTDISVEDRVNELEDEVANHCDLMSDLDEQTSTLADAIDEQDVELTVVDARLSELEEFVAVVSEKLGLNLQAVFDKSFNGE